MSAFITHTRKLPRSRHLQSSLSIPIVGLAVLKVADDQHMIIALTTMSKKLIFCSRKGVYITILLHILICALEPLTTTGAFELAQTRSESFNSVAAIIVHCDQGIISVSSLTAINSDCVSLV